MHLLRSVGSSASRRVAKAAACARALRNFSTSGAPLRVTVAEGDGIGPDITQATVKVLEASGANLAFDYIKIGKAVYEEGHGSGIAPESWDVLRENGVFLKAPITTPQGSGYKSLNVTIRKTMGLYANIRPVRSYQPFVSSVQDNIDMVIVRENEEDLYAGIEHQQTDEVVQCLKLISRPGSERIARYAYEYARAHNRKRVTVMSKDNIMKMSDGLFHKVCDEVASEYPDVESDHRIIDIGSAQIGAHPADFDVILTTNLYGDIVSDIAAEVAGSVGLCGSSNIGERFAMFEAIHGSAPDIAGQDIANPSGMLQGGVMMLSHLGLCDEAKLVENAWLRTLEDGIHTVDVASDSHTKQVVGTQAFADAVISNLGKVPVHLPAATSSAAIDAAKLVPRAREKVSTEKRLVGVDVFLRWDQDKSGQRNPNSLGEVLDTAGDETDFSLGMISNRGVKVYPDYMDETLCTDHWRCRFVTEADVDYNSALNLFNWVTNKAELDIIKTENLYEFDGVRAYSLGQGE